MVQAGGVRSGPDGERYFIIEVFLGACYTEFKAIKLEASMAVKRIQLDNFTVFEEADIDFNPGINVLIGENGMGKTHVMKLLYSACQASKHDISFAQKTVKVFGPDKLSIQRLVRRRNTGGTASVTVFSERANISMRFTTKTKKWDAEVEGEEQWEKQNYAMESVFIPAKEILSNAYNLREAAAKGNVEFDDTYLDIIASARVDISSGKDSANRKKYLDRLQKINEGKVQVEEERFYLKPGSQAKIEFNLVTEGIRKIALLWQLIKNGTLERGDVLFWDEPEANINPKYIPELAELLLMLQRDGVQIFVATHDYFLSKYLEVKRQPEDMVSYYSFYLPDKERTVVCEKADRFSLLEHNAILSTFRQLYRDELGVTLK